MGSPPVLGFKGWQEHVKGLGRWLLLSAAYIQVAEDCIPVSARGMNCPEKSESRGPNSQEAFSVVSAEVLAARTDVLELLESLRDAGARILPEVWHRATSRYITKQSTQATADVITRSGDAPSTGRSEKRSGEPDRQRCARFAFEFEFEVEL